MKIENNSERLKHYLQEYRLESVFNEQLFPYLSLYHFEQGEIICSQGDLPEYLYVLVKGKVKIYTNTADGKTLILSFKKPLELIGDIEYIRHIDIINTVDAVSPVTMIGISYRWLRAFGHEHPPLLHFFLDMLSEKLYTKTLSLSQSLMHPVEVRLASYLLSNISVDSATMLINIKDTANFIGTSYRHLNRVIEQFSREGLVERRKGFIIVKDQAGLHRLANHNIYE
ncbi:Crp/Fnr family transcriptional regulator [Pseudoneobacillus sp. C159]